MADESDMSWLDYFTTMPTRQTGYQPQKPPELTDYEREPNLPSYDYKPNEVSEYYRERRNKHVKNAMILTAIGGASTAAAHGLARTGHPLALLPALGLGGFGAFNASYAAPGQAGAAWRENDRRLMWENTHFDDPEWAGSFLPDRPKMPPRNEILNALQDQIEQEGPSDLQGVPEWLRF